MAKPNYSYEKRQRELAKKKKKEEKARDKAERKSGPGQPGDGTESAGSEGPAESVTPAPPGQATP